MVGDELSKEDLSHLLPYLTEISELVKDFRLNNDGWRTRLQDMFVSFKEERLKDDIIRSLVNSMLQRCPGRLGCYPASAEPAFGEQGPYAGGSDPGGAQGRISDQLTETYRTYVALSETKSYRAMISEMKHYIEEHFEDPDLSLKHLSDRFQISGKYASYLFKMEYDMKFVDFLVQLRMKRAEERWRRPNSPYRKLPRKSGMQTPLRSGGCLNGRPV